jgi:hypothetical protein
MAQLSLIPFELSNLFKYVYAARLIHSILFYDYTSFPSVLTIQSILYYVIYIFYAS